MPVPHKAKPKCVKKLKPVKTSIDFFWYFLVIVVAFIWVVERNVISFDNNEWQMVKELIPIIGSVMGVAAYRSHSRAKEVAEEAASELEEKQVELEETQDALTESELHKDK